MMKRILAMALALVMIIGILPVSALAAKTDSTGTITFNVKNAEGKPVSGQMNVVLRHDGGEEVIATANIAKGTGSVTLRDDVVIKLAVGDVLDCNPVSPAYWDLGEDNAKIVRTISEFSGAVAKTNNPNESVSITAANTSFAVTFDCIVTGAPVDEVIPVPENITVLFKDAAGSLIGDVQSIKDGEATVPNVADTKTEKFAGWNVNGTQYNGDFTYESLKALAVDNVVTLVAVMEKVTVNVYFHDSYSQIATHFITEGSVTPPTQDDLSTTRELLVGWTTDPRAAEVKLYKGDFAYETLIDMVDAYGAVNFYAVTEEVNVVAWTPDWSEYVSLHMDVNYNESTNEFSVDAFELKLALEEAGYHYATFSNKAEDDKVFLDEGINLYMTLCSKNPYKDPAHVDATIRLLDNSDANYVVNYNSVMVDPYLGYYSLSGITAPAGYALDEYQYPYLSQVGDDYFIDIYVHKLPLADKDVIVSVVLDGEIISTKTVTVAGEAEEVAASNIEMPVNYRLAENDKNGVIYGIVTPDGTELHADFYIEQYDVIDAQEKNFNIVSVDENGNDDGIVAETITLTQYVLSNKGVIIDEDEVVEKMRDLGYDVTVVSNIPDRGAIDVIVNDINVVYIYFNDGNDMLEIEHAPIVVDFDAKVIPLDAVTIPEGYRLTKNPGNGEIGLLPNGNKAATVFVAEIVDVQEKRIGVVEENFLFSTYIEVTTYTSTDGVVLVDESEVIEAMHEQGYVVSLKNNALVDGVLYVTAEFVEDVAVSFYCGTEILDETTVTVFSPDYVIPADAVEAPFRYEIVENGRNGVIFESIMVDEEGEEYIVYRASFEVGLTEYTPVYRMYNPYTEENLFVNEDERVSLAAAGWEDKGFVWNAATSGEPVYRMYNPYGDFHIYVADESEIKIMESNGWVMDGVATFNATGKNAVAIRRLFNPNVKAEEMKCYHYYTILQSEIDSMADAGWVVEGIAWNAYNAG